MVEPFENVYSAVDRWGGPPVGRSFQSRSRCTTSAPLTVTWNEMKPGMISRVADFTNFGWAVG